MSTSISILGNTGRDVELRYTPQGTAVANFSVASNTVRGRGDDQQKKTDWFNVTAFGRQAETLAKYLKKGASVLVRGKLTFNPWLSRDGEPRVSADVILQDFEFAGGSAAKTVSEAADESVSAQQIGQEQYAEGASETDEMTAEMIEALHETEVGEEPFAGQF